MVRIASYNVENLFARPKVFRTPDSERRRGQARGLPAGQRAVCQRRPTPTRTRRRSSACWSSSTSTSATPTARCAGETPRHRGGRGCARTAAASTASRRTRRRTSRSSPTGRASWIGWVELAKEAVDETSTRMTAKVIAEGVDADILAVVEAEDRPSLQRFNDELLDARYRHVMLVDGNDERGIDVGIMTKPGFPIGTIRSNVDAEDADGIVFSRDCPEYEVRDTGRRGPVRARQPLQEPVRRRRRPTPAPGRTRCGASSTASSATASTSSCSETSTKGPRPREPKPPTSAPCSTTTARSSTSTRCPASTSGPGPAPSTRAGSRNRLDYILISTQPRRRRSAAARSSARACGARARPAPTTWETYPEIDNGDQQASDHAAVFIDLDI